MHEVKSLSGLERLLFISLSHTQSRWSSEPIGYPRVDSDWHWESLPAHARLRPFLLARSDHRRRPDVADSPNNAEMSAWEKPLGMEEAVLGPFLLAHKGGVAMAPSHSPDCVQNGDFG